MGLRLSEKELKKILKNNSDVKINKKQNKYHNEKMIVDGVRYDSKKEYQRHKELILLEKANKIKNLRFHDKQDTVILQKDPLITYIPDFCYEEDGILIIEDLKGFQTKEFKLKKKMLISKLKKKEIIGKLRLTKYTYGYCEIIEEYTN
jgi:hypothetical protein